MLFVHFTDEMFQDRGALGSSWCCHCVGYRRRVQLLEAGTEQFEAVTSRPFIYPLSSIIVYNIETL